VRVPEEWFTCLIHIEYGGFSETCFSYETVRHAGIFSKLESKLLTKQRNKMLCDVFKMKREYFDTWDL